MRPAAGVRGQGETRVGSDKPSAGGDARVAGFRRLYRWVNLTLVHQAVWPLLLLLTTAPDVAVGRLPWPWFAARIGGPLLAVVLATLYLLQRPASSGLPAWFGSPRAGLAAGQVRFAVAALCAILAVARVIGGPTVEVGRFLLFGLVDVAAFQVIHFGVVAAAYPDRDRGQAVAVLLFGVSWAGRDAMRATLSAGDLSIPLAFGGGLVAGLTIALLARGLRAWPGGAWVAMATHWLLVYAILGFVD